MFNLNDFIISIPLDTINLITLAYYSSKSEIFNIYDTNFVFNENSIPLITSVLEITPHILHAKRYCNINSEALIIIDSRYNMPNKSYLQYPSLLHDLQNNCRGHSNNNGSNMSNIQGYTRKLVNSLDNINDNILIRMYNLESKTNEFSQNILNEEELTIIVWNWEYVNVQLIINKNNTKECQIQINIYVSETNKMISAKLDTINQIIFKLDKIKKECFI